MSPAAPMASAQANPVSSYTRLDIKRTTDIYTQIFVQLLSEIMGSELSFWPTFFLAFISQSMTVMEMKEMTMPQSVVSGL